MAEDIAVMPARARHTDLDLLRYLEALTFDLERAGPTVSAILVYAEPHPEQNGVYRPVVAAETGYEGIACVDDTARAALLALGVYERTRWPRAMGLARRWLSFVEYMQYPDGSFANFIRNAAGVRNASGATSHRGGYWWSSRALRALARAYRLLGRKKYLERYRACTLAPLPDGKINGLLALAEMELLAAGEEEARKPLERYIERIVETTGQAPYLLDHPGSPFIHLWGYHQFEALAAAVGILDRPDLLPLCRRTVQHLVEPDVRARGWHAYPPVQKDGVTAYDITPLVLGLGAMYRTTGAERYRDLALRAAAWYYGRNDARAAMYDPTTGRCRDGITGGIASINCGAESSIEAGFAELERRALDGD